MELIKIFGIAVGVSLGINLIMFIPAFIWKTDKLTDISYAVTFATIAIVAFFVTPSTPFTMVLLGMILVWALRLGTYLFIRINKTGKDARFDGMREYFWKFLRFWIVQGITVFVVMIASVIGFAQAPHTVPVISIIGLIIFLIGLVIESMADIQKYRFMNNPANQGKWIDIGVWHYSRHPNYFGEISVWIGVYLFVIPALVGGQFFLALASPAFIAGMILFVSGIPLLEKSADARWGNDSAYQNYKRGTSVLIPWFRK